MQLRTVQWVLLVALTVLGFSGGLKLYAAEAQMVTVAKGGPFVLPNIKEQCFTSKINIEPSQVNVPLKLTLMNGVDARPGLTWIRIYLTNPQVGNLTSHEVLGTLLAASNNFAATKQIAVDLNGKVRSGQYAIAVQCGGRAGAACFWELTAPQVTAPKVAEVRPDTVMVGETVTITGTGFDGTADNNVVMLDRTPARVVSATCTSITARVPENMQIGSCKLQVKSGGVPSNVLELNVRGMPQVTGADMGGVRPHGLVHIYGKNFAPDAGANTVTFTSAYCPPMSATVESAKPGSLTVEAPQPAGLGFAPGLNWPCSVTVVSGGVKAKGDLTINLTGTGEWPSNTGQAEGPQN